MSGYLINIFIPVMFLCAWMGICTSSFEKFLRDICSELRAIKERLPK